MLTLQKPRLSPGPSIVLEKHLGVKCRGKSSVRPGPGIVLGRRLALVTGLSQHKAGAWFRAGEAAGSDTGLSQRKAGAWFRAGEAAGSVNILQVRLSALPVATLHLLSVCLFVVSALLFVCSVGSQCTFL